MLYTEIIIGDIFDVESKLGAYDIAILGDIIEHFPKEKGMLLIDRLFNHVEDIIITTPLGFLEHTGHTANIHEEHKSGWTPEDFKAFSIVDSAIVSRIRKNESVLVVYIRKK